MKKVLSLFASALLFTSFCRAQDKDPVLMNVCGTDVTLSEFMNVYKKNNKDQGNDPKALENYLELFTTFKMKVKEAEEMKLDTSKAFQQELSGYRRQLAQPYLTDKDVNEKLIREAYERMKQDVHAYHILIKCEENALPKDTDAAYKKCMDIRKRLMKGENFEQLAKQVSDDPSAKDNGGDLGYFTALQMVYPFETAAYAAKVGEISMPVRSRFGYHLIKVVDKREAQGEILVAHIMVKAAAGISADDSLKAKQKIDELYGKVTGGQDFADLARQYSDDKPSAQKGGELPWFGSYRMPPEFEKASFALAKNGDISAPIRTRFGWHIIKRIDKRGIQQYDEVKNDLKTRVSRDSRSQKGRESLITRVKKEGNFTEVANAKTPFNKLIDSTYFQGHWTADKAKILTGPMFTLGGTTYTQKDFAAYLESHQTRRQKTAAEQVVNTTYKQWVDETTVAYEESQLDKKYPEFRALMQEYRDGILLFDLMDRKVWSKAVKDTTGLKAYYEQNKTKYMWDERADATIYTCKDAATSKAVRKMMKKKKTDKEILDAINKNSQLNLSIESKLYNKKENELVDANWKAGISPDVNKDKNVVFVVVKKIVPPTPKSLQESKGLVTADYQNQLEKDWVDELKRKCKVSVNQDVLNQAKAMGSH